MGVRWQEEDERTGWTVQSWEAMGSFGRVVSSRSAWSESECKDGAFWECHVVGGEAWMEAENAAGRRMSRLQLL